MHSRAQIKCRTPWICQASQAWTVALYMMIRCSVQIQVAQDRTLTQAQYRQQIDRVPLVGGKCYNKTVYKSACIGCASPALCWCAGAGQTAGSGWGGAGRLGTPPQSMSHDPSCLWVWSCCGFCLTVKAKCGDPRLSSKNKICFVCSGQSNSQECFISAVRGHEVWSELCNKYFVKLVVTAHYFCLGQYQIQCWFCIFLEEDSFEITLFIWKNVRLGSIEV